MAVMAFPAAAAPQPALHYLLDLPSDRRLSYEIEFEVVEAGTLRIEAGWEPARVLSFRIQRPGMADFRRSGRPPLKFELPVSAAEVQRDSPWTLVIVGLSSREASKGDLFIHLPSGIEEEAVPPQPTVPTPGERETPNESWMLPVTAPGGIDAVRRRLFDRTELLRQAVVADGRTSTHGWRHGLLQFIATHRDRSLSTESVLQRPTRSILLRLAEIVHEIERLSLQDNQPLNEPPPESGLRRRAWESVRDPRFLPVESELDTLFTELQQGHAPELISQPAFSRFFSIVIACEREFEERARLGSHYASNAPVLRNEWQQVLAAAAALEALARLP